MPIYEYACQKCGERTEALQKMNDAPLTVCAVCGGPLKRLISKPAVQFKGSGWYVTDYARKSTGAASKSEGTAGESKSETPAGESKAAAGGSSAATETGSGSSGAKAEKASGNGKSSTKSES